MTDQHPITPPPKLVQQWHVEAMAGFRTNGIYEQDVATQAARWGADQELEACCKLFESNSVCGTKFQRRSSVRDLRDKRRPKPPSLKERAFIALREVGSCEEIDNTTYNTIRKALEALPND